jgi:hypothetical protein
MRLDREAARRHHLGMGAAVHSIHVSQIAIYPIKSCHPVYCDSAALTETGLEHDRAWLIVDEDGMFVTQRQFPAMARITCVPREESIEISIPDQARVDVPVTNDGTRRSVTIWGTECEAVDQGDEIATALSEFLGRACRLVRMHPDFRRALGSSYAAVSAMAVGFADSSPLLLISEASLHDLNKRLDEPVTMDRFRPNIVVAGGVPYQEDAWSRIQVGTATLHVVKACIRCEIPTVDQTTGEKGVEPIETLETYRAGPMGTRFGQKVAHETLGTISVGDTVRVLA